METELLVPGVQNGGESDGGLELAPGDLEKGLGDRLEEKSQADLGRPAEERVKLPGDGEDDLEVPGGQEQCFLRFGPQLLLQDLTLGAVPISAGVVGPAGEAAVRAHLEMPAQFVGTAGDGVAHGPGLGSGEVQAVRMVA